MARNLMIKQKLYSECLKYIESKIEQISGAIDELQHAANLEIKSSMGDKYETGRSAIHLEMEKYSQQLNEFYKLKKALSQINADKIYDFVQPGSVVYTNCGNFFIAINAGEFEIEGSGFLTISLASPIGKELYKRKAGDTFSFRDKIFEINCLF